ncbi:MAG: response regulator [Proteobacteria bacterium]|nr:response regulator [Pseudomonadota bacterium]
MRWLPASPEGRLLFRLGLGSLFATVCLVTGILAFLVPWLVEAQGGQSRAAQIALGALVSLTGALVIPFFVRLGRGWIAPVERIVDADRATGPDISGTPLPVGEFPSGVIRELVVRRNQRIEALRARDEDLSRRRADTEVLYELSRQLGLSRDAPDVPNLVLTFLARAVEHDVGVLLVFVDDQRSLSLRARAPLPDALRSAIEAVALNAYFERSGVLLETDVLEPKETVIDLRAPALEARIRTAHWAPLMVNQRVVGVVGALSVTDRGALSLESLRMLNIIAQTASMALDKVQMQRIEETQRFRNVLENLTEGVVLVRQSGEWALATGTARAFHQSICGDGAQQTPEHSRHCPVGLLGHDVFHSGVGATREITRNDRTFILVGTFVRSAAAGEQGTVISIRDVTEERATQQKLFQASKLASLGELAAGVAHEVNNPLMGILGFSELTLARSDLTPAVAEALHEINTLARRTNQITMDLLTFARVQREGGFHAVSLRAVVKDTVKLLETSYRTLKLDLVAELEPPDDPLMALGDAGKIRQIVTNLAQNAKDAIVMSGKGHAITFKGYRQKGEVVLEVRDDGPGIPDAIRNKIFEPFFTTKPVGKGTGLGLAIVNRLIEEHKGRLVIDSDEGRGTIFRISLPEAPPDVAEPPAERAPGAAGSAAATATTEPERAAVASAIAGPPPRASAPTGGARATVVVLDDETTVLKVLSRALESEGIAVHATSEPDEAVSLIERHEPQIIFLDFRMPTCTGEEFYARLIARDRRWAERVVFLSGDLSGDEIQGFLRDVGAPALRKPVGVSELRAFVDGRLAVRSGGAETGGEGSS